MAGCSGWAWYWAQPAKAKNSIHAAMAPSPKNRPCRGLSCCGALVNDQVFLSNEHTPVMGLKFGLSVHSDDTAVYRVNQTETAPNLQYEDA